MELRGSDKPAAFAGLIGGAIAIFAVCYALVLWTSARFEGHTPGRPNATHAAPAAGGAAGAPGGAAPQH